jgi:uncharacterized protein
MTKISKKSLISLSFIICHLSFSAALVSCQFEDEDFFDEDEEEGPDYALVGADSTIDLSDTVLGALCLDIPYVVLCREDCKGLCPVCGENLNHTDCGHAAEREREREEARIASSPFAVLKNLDFGDKGDA